MKPKRLPCGLRFASLVRRIGRRRRRSRLARRGRAARALVGLGAAWMAAACPWPAGAQPVTLVKDGVAQMPLWIGSVPEPAAELQRYLREMSGTELHAARPGAAAQGVFVGLAADFAPFAFPDTGGLDREGFMLRSDGTNLFLIAREPPGVQHAVTTFLQSLGCRWFFPGRAWEIIPSRRTVAGSWDERGAPSFTMQRKIWYGFGAYPPCARDLDDWQRHNRLGGRVEVSIGHTSHGLDFEKDFAGHPEWFALVRGERKATKPCYSEPAVARRAIDHALAEAARGAAMISMTPPDGLGYCECDRCFAVFRGAKPVEEHGSHFARRPDGTVVNVTSETLFSCVNQVAAAVVAKHPDAWIGCYAYSAYAHPPSFKLHPRVFVQTTTAFRRTGLSLEEQLDAWSRCTAHLGIRDYYSVYQWDWDYPMVGKLEPALLQKELQFFHGKGVTSVNAEASNNWGPRGLGYYLAAHLMWDANADVPALLRDFYDQAFGPAAAVMERYYVRWYGPSAAAPIRAAPAGSRAAPEAVRTAPGAGDELQNDQPAARLTPETLAASFRDLDEAARLVRGHPACRARVDALRMYWHYLYLRQRLDEAERTKDADAILKAIHAEMAFGGRLAHSNMIHTRALLGKALLRRFRKFETLLAGRPEVQKEGQGWRQIGTPPGPDEMERIWQADLEALSGRGTARLREYEGGVP